MKDMKKKAEETLTRMLKSEFYHNGLSDAILDFLDDLSDDEAFELSEFIEENIDNINVTLDI